MTLPRSLAAYRRHYAGGASVAETMSEVRTRIQDHADPALFIGDLCDLDVQAASLDAVDPTLRSSLPLFGVPVAVKDNIDVAGTATTAGCPGFSRHAGRHAVAVALLLDAGAVVVGKTNLDQFATGLVGTRSPFGTPRNPIDPGVVPGGSSSGSGAAVAAGIVPVALGTDTAGSGRVPAAMTQVVGLKPTRGVVSTGGVIPACASLDCVSVLATSVADARAVLDVVRAPDSGDPWARPDRSLLRPIDPSAARLGVPQPRALAEVHPAILRSYSSAVEVLRGSGATTTAVDLARLLEAGDLLYGGSLVAERTAAVGSFVEKEPDAVLDITRSIILGGNRWTAVDHHRTWERIHQLRLVTRRMWDTIDALLLPTVPVAPTIAEVAADPVGVNNRLGRFTTFANILDLAAITVPDPTVPRPGHGVTLYGPANSDHRLAELAVQLGV